MILQAQRPVQMCVDPIALGRSIKLIPVYW